MPIDAEPARIEYKAPDGCPTASQFVDEIRARSDRLRIAEPTERSRTYAVVIQEENGRYTGQLVVREVNGRESNRVVSDERCPDLTAALAIIVAVQLDPQARKDESPPVEARTDARPDTPSDTRSDTRSNESAGATARGPVWRGSGIVGGGGMGAVGPSPAPYVSAAFDIRRTDISLLFAPVFRLSMDVSYLDQALLTYVLGTMGFEACPLQWRPARSLALEPCGRFDIGFQNVFSNEPFGTSTTTPWFAPRFVGRVRWNPTGPWIFEATASAVVPLIRERVYFANRSSGIYETPALSYSAAIGFGLFFW